MFMLVPETAFVDKYPRSPVVTTSKGDKVMMSSSFEVSGPSWARRLLVMVKLAIAARQAVV
jgi:hypothetical protein